METDQFGANKSGRKEATTRSIPFVPIARGGTILSPLTIALTSRMIAMETSNDLGARATSVCIVIQTTGPSVVVRATRLVSTFELLSSVESTGIAM